MSDLLLDYSLMKAGRRPLAVFRMRGATFRRGELSPTTYGGWRVHCRCCEWDDWAKRPYTHAAAMDTAYTHAALCPKAGETR